jgi:plasmid stabilization system protein ParE
VRVELHPEARAELRSAALWYEERRSGFGDRLIERLNEAFSRVSAAPEIYASWPGTAHAPIPIRRAGVEQFPYFVAFEVHADHVLVLAIAHGKRRPLYWLARATRGLG